MLDCFQRDLVMRNIPLARFMARKFPYLIDAEPIALLALCDAARCWQRVKAFSSYAARVMLNQMIDAMRRQATQDRVTYSTDAIEQVADSVPDDEGAYCVDTALAELISCLSECKAAAVRAWVNGGEPVTFRETGLRLGISETAAKHRVYRGLSKIRKYRTRRRRESVGAA